MFAYNYKGYDVSLESFEGVCCMEVVKEDQQYVTAALKAKPKSFYAPDDGDAVALDRRVRDYIDSL